MEYNREIKALAVGDNIEGFYILNRAQVKIASNGKPFLSAILSDKTGEIEGKAWDYPGPISSTDEGKIVKIRGSISEFRGTLQMRIERIRLVEPGDTYDPGRLIPVAPINVEKMYIEIRERLESIEDADYRRMSLELLLRHKERFITIPAAQSMHHGFLHGLLMHTGNMMRIADFLARLYADTVNRSLLLAGTFAHDLQKETEFALSELGLVADYTVKGVLLGHLVMGAQEIGMVAKELSIPEEKSVLLQHMILSHHGQPEFGAAVVPKCAESELLSYIDLIDSRMEIYRENLDQMEPGETSKRIFALGKSIYRHM